MLDLKVVFGDNFEAQAEYLIGKAQNEIVEGDGLGSPWHELVINSTILGPISALLWWADITPDGSEEKAGQSQWTNALQIFSKDMNWGENFRGRFSKGLVFTTDNDVGRGQDGLYYKYIGSDPFPKTVPAGVTPSTLPSDYEEIKNNSAESIIAEDGRTLQQIVDELPNIGIYNTVVSDPLVLADQQTSLVFTDFVASLTAYYLVPPAYTDIPAYRLFKGVHYEHSEVDADRIELNQSYPSGFMVVAIKAEVEGSGPSPTTIPYQFATITALQEAALNEGLYVTVNELKGARYLITDSSYTPLQGDITLNNGNVAVLQQNFDGSYDATWFGVKDDQANALGSQIELLRDAAQRAALTLGSVNIPNIKFNVSGTPIDEEVTWILNQDTNFDGLPGVPPSFAYDLTQLGGKVIIRNDSATNRGNMVYYGDGGYAVQKVTGRSPVGACVTGASPNASGGLSGITNTAPATDNGQGTIAVRGIVVNDNVNPSLIRTAWAGYFETYTLPNTKGVTQGVEIACINKNPVVANYDPTTLVNDQREGLGIGAWIGCGIGESSDEDVSVAMAIISDSIGADPAKFTRGIVFKENVTRTGEVIAASSGDQFAWYDTRASGNGKLSYISGANTSTNRGRVIIGTKNLPAQAFTEYLIDRAAFATSTNNEVDLGRGTNRFKSLYLQNAPDVTSDIDKKQSQRDLNAGEVNAALEIARNVQLYKWIDEVNEKGDESLAYYHCSVMAQELWQILLDNNLDPTEYGFVSNQEGHWSIIASELSLFISRAIVKRQDEIETRLAALEDGL